MLLALLDSRGIGVAQPSWKIRLPVTHLKSHREAVLGLGMGFGDPGSWPGGSAGPSPLPPSDPTLCFGKGGGMYKLIT